MRHRVEKPYNNQYVYPTLEVECKESNDALNNIRLLGMLLDHKFSSSVALKLYYFKNTI